MKNRKIADLYKNTNSKKKEITSSKKTIDNNSTQPDIQMSPSVKDHQLDDNEYFKKLIIQKINNKTINMSNKKQQRNISIPSKGNEIELIKKPLNITKEEKLSNIMYKLHCNSNNLNNNNIIPNNLNTELLKLETNDNLSEINLLNYDTKSLQTPKELLDENLKTYEINNTEYCNLPEKEIYRKVKLKKRNSITGNSGNKKGNIKIETLSLSQMDINNNSLSLDNSNSSLKSKISKPSQKLDKKALEAYSLSTDKKKKSDVQSNPLIITEDINKEFLDLIPFFENMIGNNFQSFNENSFLDCLNSQDKNMLIKGLIYCILDLNKKVKPNPIVEDKLTSIPKKTLVNEKMYQTSNEKINKISSRNEILKSNQTISYDDNNSKSKNFGKFLPNCSKKSDKQTNSKSKYVNTKF